MGEWRNIIIRLSQEYRRGLVDTTMPTNPFNRDHP